MTDQPGALAGAGGSTPELAEPALESSPRDLRSEALVIRQLVRVQGPPPRTAAACSARAKRLMKHRHFLDCGNPNRAKELAAAACAGNPSPFIAPMVRLLRSWLGRPRAERPINSALASRIARIGADALVAAGSSPTAPAARDAWRSWPLRPTSRNDVRDIVTHALESTTAHFPMTARWRRLRRRETRSIPIRATYRGDQRRRLAA